MYFTKKSLKEIKRDYFNMLTEMIKTGLFDAVAHLDIYTRYGIRQFGEKIKTIHRGIIEPVLKEIASRHMALEINTSSISRGLKEFHPSREIISLAKRAGVMVFTVGSDAHKLAGLGEHINEALLLLDEFNLNNHVYTNHKACPLP